MIARLVWGRDVGAGSPPAGARRLAGARLLVLIGLTGVGKTTALDALARMRPEIAALPDRRAITDLVIIPQTARPDEVITDRATRFAITARFRKTAPGGMADVLAALWISDMMGDDALLFDGLRGADEARAAIAALPHARFAMLDAPDATRLQRLTARGDAFDGLQDGAAAADADALRARLMRSDLFRADAAAIAAALSADGVDLASLDGAIGIVESEAQNYAAAATRDALAGAGPRAEVIDTAACGPEAVAAALAALAG